MNLTSSSETIAGSVTLAVSWIMLLLRVIQQISTYTRTSTLIPFTKRRPVSEIVGTLFFIASTVLLSTLFSIRLWNTIQEKQRTGSDVSNEFLSRTIHNNDIIAFLAPSSIWALKGSYVCIFWSMVSIMRRKIRISLVCLTFYMVASYIVVIGVDLLWCRPLARIWTFDGTYNKCNSISIWDVAPFNIKFAMTITTDLSILIFTLCLLRPSEIRQQGIDMRSVMLVVAIGSLSIIAAVGRYTFNRLLIAHSSSPMAIQYNHGYNVFQCLEIMFATLAYGLISAKQVLLVFLGVLRKLSRHRRSGWSPAASPAASPGLNSGFSA